MRTALFISCFLHTSFWSAYICGHPQIHLPFIHHSLNDKAKCVGWKKAADCKTWAGRDWGRNFIPASVRYSGSTQSFWMFKNLNNLASGSFFFFKASTLKSFSGIIQMLMYSNNLHLVCSNLPSFLLRKQNDRPSFSFVATSISNTVEIIDVFDLLLIFYKNLIVGWEVWCFLTYF